MESLRKSNAVMILVERSRKNSEFLLKWHDAWHCFMLPATRPRHIVDGNWGIDQSETPQEAATRATAEACGMCVRTDGFRRMRNPISLTAFSVGQDRVTGYSCDVFQYRLSGDTVIQPQRAIQWLSLEDIVDSGLGPISSVARHLARAVLEQSFDARTAGAHSDTLWEDHYGQTLREESVCLTS